MISRLLGRITGRAGVGTVARVMIRVLALAGNTVAAPCKLRALNAGPGRFWTDVIAITDAAPRADRLARMAADARVGDVGARDLCHDGTGFDERRASVVGRMHWVGRATGNHRQGVSEPRFDEEVRGRGARPMEDLAFSAAVPPTGCTLLPDPALTVNHRPGQRRAAPRYVGFDQATVRLAFVPWSVPVETEPSPGLLQAVRYTPCLGIGAWRRFVAVQRARWSALVLLRGGLQALSIVPNARSGSSGS